MDSLAAGVSESARQSGSRLGQSYNPPPQPRNALAVGTPATLVAGDSETNERKFDILMKMESEKFDLGRVVSTPSAIEKMAAMDPDGNHRRVAAEMICRHHHGDWGDIPQEDATANNYAIENGSRIVSVYKEHGQDFFVITEAVNDDGVRSSTTLLLPEDY